MAYEDKTIELLHEELLTNVDDSIDKREGSITHDLTGPAAHEFANTYVELDTVYGLAFADTSEGEHLDRICIPFGVIRKQAEKAKGEVTFTGPIGTPIPINTRVQTTIGESVFFMTTEEATLITESVKVPVIAEIGGVSGNVGIGEINALAPGDLYGVVTVTNEAALEGGVDMESDESLLSRLESRARNPATSGNANHYKQWALEVPGVSNAKVFPVWNGGNTVKVVLLSDDYRKPDPGIVEKAVVHIEASRPVGPEVTVIGADEVNINVTATLIVESDKTTEEAKTEFISLVNEYLKTLAFVDPIIRYAKIASLLIDVSSIVDYSNLTINGGTNNITITGEQVAVLGEVTFT